MSLNFDSNFQKNSWIILEKFLNNVIITENFEKFQKNFGEYIEKIRNNLREI